MIGADTNMSMGRLRMLSGGSVSQGIEYVSYVLRWGFSVGVPRKVDGEGRACFTHFWRDAEDGRYLDEDSYVANPRACVTLNGQILTPLGYFVDVIRRGSVTKSTGFAT